MEDIDNKWFYRKPWEFSDEEEDEEFHMQEDCKKNNTNKDETSQNENIVNTIAYDLCRSIIEDVLEIHFKNNIHTIQINTNT